MNLLGHMTTFVRTVEAKSLSGAARDLRLSLPAVSRQLRALEEDMGTVLLMRTTRRMALTEQGRLFYERAVHILREVEETRARLAPGRDVRGTLVVSAPISIALSLVLPRLPALSAKHPHLALDLRLEDRLVDFVREGIDVAIRGGATPPDSTSYLAQQLTHFERLLVASPAYLRKHGAPSAPEDLVRHECLLQVGSGGPISRWRLVRGDGETREVEVTGGVRSNAPLALARLARQGMGIALVADWLVEDDLADKTLRRVLPAWATKSVATLAIYRVERKGSPLIGAFIEAMRGLRKPKRQISV